MQTQKLHYCGVCIKENFLEYKIHFKSIDTINKNIKEITQEYTSHWSHILKNIQINTFGFIEDGKLHRKIY